jgi:hypothetical protein
MKPFAIPKYLRQPLLLGGITIVVLLALWSVQQHNVNSLVQQINDLQQQIDTLPAKVAPKDKLVLKKDLLTLEKDRINAQNAIYGTLVQALGGVFFGVTAYFTYRNVRATEANVRAAEEKQVTERFSKAIELLGSEKLEVRLGGIYALERIAKDSPKDHWTIMEVLTSFVQEKSPLSQNIQHRDEQSNSSSQTQENKKITTDVQAALTVIRRRDSSKEKDWRQRIELPSTNLIKANLSGANLFFANLSGANLIKANLSGANLSEAIAFTLKQISEATTDEKTKLPDYLQAPKLSQPEPLDPKQP